jgi:protein-disulfide isomerase
MEETTKKDSLLPYSIIVAAVLVSGSVIYLAGSYNKSGGQTAIVADGGNQPNPNVVAGSAPMTADRDVILGDPKAPVSVIEYADFQCPFCGRFYSQAASQIIENFVKTGKVKMVYRHFAFLGPESIAAAEASECAKDQNKFWPFHDVLYEEEIKDGQEHNGNLNTDLFVKLASGVGMDANSFKDCITSKKYVDVVKKAVSDAQAAGVNSTPTIFVNDQKLLGALPYQQFADAIEAALKK